MLLKAETISDHRKAGAGSGWEPEAFFPGELAATMQELHDGTWQSSQAGTPAAGRADASWERAHLRTQSGAPAGRESRCSGARQGC